MSLASQLLALATAIGQWGKGIDARIDVLELGGGGGTAGDHYDLTTDYTDTTPTAPATGVRLFARNRARRLPAVVGPSGQDTQLQPALFSNRVMWVMAQPNNANLASMGVIIVNLSAGGTALTAVAQVPATNFYAGMIRVRASTTAVAAVGAGIRGNAPFAFLSSVANLGGFFFVARFGIQASTATSRLFVGLYNTGAAYPPASQPSAVLNEIGFGFDSTDTNIQFMRNDASGTATKVDMGASFPARTADATNFYEVRLFSPAGAGQTVYYSIHRLNDGVVVQGGPITTKLPALNMLLAPHINLSNGTTAAIASIDVQSMYVETDN